MTHVDAPDGRQTGEKAAVLAARLVANLTALPNCIVAFSGGVDSAVVAKAAQLALGDQAIAMTGVSASLAEGELDVVRRVAEAIGIHHVIVSTDELADDAYLSNGPDRCFHCKTELYQRLEWEATQRDVAALLNGANADDLDDFRPGMQAASRYQVRSPLAECGLTKVQVRALAHFWELEVWDKPATPCLSSRVVYGVGITPERLARIDGAEQLLRSLGLSTVRVRHHENDLVRLEVPLDALSALCVESTRRQVVDRLHELGFRYITLDLEGFRSGSFQQLVPLEQLEQFRT